MNLLLVKLLLSPALVGSAWMAGRRWGPRVAGLLVALPIVAGPILFFYAVEQGPGFAASAARSTLLGLVPLTCFCLVHAVMARAAIRLPRRLAAPLSLVVGWCAFLALAASLRPLHLLDHPALELALRMGAAALLVTALTGLAAPLGATWSGLLTPFPVASSVVVIGAHLADGPGSLPETLRGFLLGLFGFVAFLTVLAYGLAPLGVVGAFEIGIGASLAVSSGPLLLPRPGPR